MKKSIRTYTALGVAALVGAGAALPGNAAKTVKSTKHAPSHLPKLPPTAPLPVHAPAQTSSPDDVIVYNGQAADAAKIALAAWGAGSAEDSKDLVYNKQNGHSILITTRNYYEGGRIDFTPGVDWRVSNPNANRVILLKIKVEKPADDTDSGDLGTNAPITPTASGPVFQNESYDGQPAPVRSAIYSGGAGFRLAQGPPAGFQLPPGVQLPPGFQLPPGVNIPGLKPQGAPKGNNNRTPASSSPSGLPPGIKLPPGFQLPPGVRIPGMNVPNQQQPPEKQPVHDTGPSDVPLHNVRLLFTLDNGAQAETVRPVPLRSYDGSFDLDQWVDVAVPMKMLKFNGETAGAKLQSLTIGGDDYSKFHIGQIKIISDDAPITCSAGGAMRVAAADEVDLHAIAQGGASTLKYSWDFDASDGIQEQASGPDVTTQYYKGDKDYTVTLTVSDVDGLKKPAVSTTVIHVED